MAICLNVSLVPLFLLVAFVVGDRPIVYAIACVVLWLTIGAPIWGWLFEAFARNSSRITDASIPGSAQASFE